MNTPVDLNDNNAPELLDNRSQNEREVLALIRQHGALPKATISKMTGLSAQSATVIIKKLEADDLVKRLSPLKGAKGQPKIPFALNEGGAFSVGLKIGRRSYDMTLIDFVGNVVASLHERVDFPSVDSLLSFSQRAFNVVASSLDQCLTTRIRGIGVAMPFEIWHWAEEAGAPIEVLKQWQQCDIASQLNALLALPVFVRNDAAAACSAELSFGNAHQWRNFLYIFVGTFVGGGLVLNGSLLEGKSGRAGAIGSLSLFNGKEVQQLIKQSSLYLLEQQLNANGENGGLLYEHPSHWQYSPHEVTTWISNASQGLAYASHCAMSLLDLDGIIIDGAMPNDVRQALVDTTQNALSRLDMRGLSPITITAGNVGAKAQSIGSANLPLLANYA